MTATANLPSTVLIDSLVGNYQGSTRKIPLTALAALIGDGSGSGAPAVIAQLQADMLAADADLRSSIGKIFGTRQQAVDEGQGKLPSGVNRILTFEGDLAALRGPNMNEAGSNPLFGSSPYWGVVDRIPTTRGLVRAGVLPLNTTSSVGNFHATTVDPILRASGAGLPHEVLLHFTPETSNTGPAFLTISSVQASSPILNSDGQPLAAGELQAYRTYILQWRAARTSFRIVAGDVTPAALAAMRSGVLADAAAASNAAVTAARNEVYYRTQVLAAALARAGAVTPPVRDMLLDDSADIRIHPGAAITEAGGKLIALTATGKLGLTFDAISSPDIDVQSDGLRFNAAGMLSWTASTAEDYTGALIMLDVTRNADPAASSGDIIVLDTGAGQQMRFRYSAAAGLQALGPGNVIVTLAAIGGYGDRQKIGVLVDFTGGAMTVISADGVSQQIATPAATALNLDQIRLGNNANVTIHDCAVFLTTAGVPDIDLWHGVFAPPAPAAEPATVTEVTVVDGQSNALGPNAVPARNHLRTLAYDTVMMPDGMYNTSATRVWLHGPGLGSYDTGTPATDLVSANAQGNVPIGFSLAVAQALHRKRLGLPARRQITGFAGVAGQSQDEFDDNIPDPTGTTGTTIHDNWEYLLSEIGRLGGDVRAGLMGILQGEADKHEAPGWWLAAATETVRDRAVMYQSIFGELPRIGVFQVNGTSDTAGEPWHCKTDQLDFVDYMGGVFLAPMHQFPIDPALGDHTTWQGSLLAADVAAWVLTEIEAGRTMPMLRPAITLDGSVVTLRYDLRPDEMLRRLDGKYDTPEPHWGFEVAGTTITGIEQLGARVIRITCAAAPTAISYAMQERDLSGATWGAHRGEIATTLTAPSTLFPGETLTREAPGWRYSF